MYSVIIKLAEKLTPLKRYHNSKDMHYAVDKLVEYFGGIPDVYLDNLGTTWRIPQYYSVHSATLSRNGKIIADYFIHPLCLWSYSSSFKGRLTLTELKDKILFDPERPKARIFHFRNQYRQEKRVWGFSIPYEQYSSFKETDIFDVDIKTSFDKYPMKQYFCGKPQKNKNFILVAHLDHPNQLNDGLSSCILNNFIYSTLKNKLKTINLISLNSVEITGTVLFLKKYGLNNSNTIGAISTNGLMSKYDITLQYSARNGINKLDKLLKLYSKIYLSQVSKKIEKFREGWGNDEIAFEVPKISIPCVSIYRFLKDEYHSDADNLSKLDQDSLDSSYNFLCSFIEAIDCERTIEANFDHLLCLSSSEINLYLEPQKTSGIMLNEIDLESSLFSDLNEMELYYIKNNIQLLNIFMNNFIPYLYYEKDPTILGVALESALPPKFILAYFLRLQKLGHVNLKP